MSNMAIAKMAAMLRASEGMDGNEKSKKKNWRKKRDTKRLLQKHQKKRNRK